METPMSHDKLSDTSTIVQRVQGELMDSFDEELEMEIDDERLANLLDDIADHPGQATINRSKYFKELFRLQGELVRLQNWVVHRKLKVVVIFEGRSEERRVGKECR